MASKEDSTNLGNKREKGTYYSDSEALIVAKNLQDETTFEEALCTLKVWLEKGECTEQTADNFYSLIQGACAYANYLQQKKDDFKNKISKIQSELVQHIKNAFAQFDTMKAILNLAEEEKVQNLFTKSQSNDIKMSKAVIEKCQKKLMEELAVIDNSNSLKDKSISSCNLVGKGVNRSSDIEELQREKEKLQEEKQRISSQLKEVQEEKKRLLDEVTASNVQYKQSHKVTDYTSSIDSFNSDIQKQAHLISVISPFLYVHRDYGQTLTVILSHLQYLGFRVSEQEVEDVLVSNPSIFEARLYDKGTGVEKRWIFCGYEPGLYRF